MSFYSSVMAENSPRRRSRRSSKTMDDLLADCKLPEKEKQNLLLFHTSERDRLLGEITNKNTDITGKQTKIDNLQNQIDAMARKHAEDYLKLEQERDELLAKVDKVTESKDNLSHELHKMEKLTDELVQKQITDDVQSEPKAKIGLVFDKLFEEAGNLPFPDNAVWEASEDIKTINELHQLLQDENSCKQLAKKDLIILLLGGSEIVDNDNRAYKSYVDSILALSQITNVAVVELP